VSALRKERRRQCETNQGTLPAVSSHINTSLVQIGLRRTSTDCPT
jgi:hypothetical protein